MCSKPYGSACGGDRPELEALARAQNSAAASQAVA
jgi:hypothetical protein